MAIGGEAVGARRRTLRRRIGYVFQNVGLFPHMSVAENIAIGLQPRRREGTGRRGSPNCSIWSTCPQDFAARMPDALSGGQRQRVGVARALASAPGLMLMDEPFGALDPVTRDELGEAIRALHDRLGLTTIMVTHDMAEALLLADRVLVMDAGRIVADATPPDCSRARAARWPTRWSRSRASRPQPPGAGAGRVSPFLDALRASPTCSPRTSCWRRRRWCSGSSISLPLAICRRADRRSRGSRSASPALSRRSPALALLALFYPMLLSLSALVGGGIPALGFLPSLLALALYALLPILRNGVTGLLDIDPAVLEAADGVGMTRGRSCGWSRRRWSRPC